MHESSIPGTIGGKSGHRDKQTKSGTIQGNPGRLASMGYVGMCNGRSAQQEFGAALSKNSMFTAGA